MKGVAVSWEGRGTCESVGEHGQYLKLHERSLPKGVLLRAVKVTRKLSHRGHSVTTYTVDVWKTWRKGNLKTRTGMRLMRAPRRQSSESTTV